MLGAKARSLTMLKMNKLLPAHLFLHPHQTMLLRLIISVEMPTDLKDRLGRPKRHLLQPPFIPMPTSTQHQLLKRLYSPRLLMEANRSPPWRSQQIQIIPTNSFHHLLGRSSLLAPYHPRHQSTTRGNSSLSNIKLFLVAYPMVVGQDLRMMN